MKCIDFSKENFTINIFHEILHWLTIIHVWETNYSVNKYGEFSTSTRQLFYNNGQLTFKSYRIPGILITNYIINYWNSILKIGFPISATLFYLAHIKRYLSLQVILSKLASPRNVAKLFIANTITKHNNKQLLCHNRVYKHYMKNV